MASSLKYGLGKYKNKKVEYFSKQKQIEAKFL